MGCSVPVTEEEGVPVCDDDGVRVLELDAVDVIVDVLNAVGVDVHVGVGD